MATVGNISPPKEFDFSNPGDFKSWFTRFERYRMCTKLNNESDEIQISTLLYVMGEQSENILQSFALSDDDSKKYDTVSKSFKDYFQPCENILSLRKKFYRRMQQSAESAEQYIRSLYELSGRCDFGANKDTVIRDQLLIGMSDKGLSDKLEMLHITTPQTLESVKLKMRQSECVKSSKADVDRVVFNKSKSVFKKPIAHHKQSKGKCSKCGYLEHRTKGGSCPAKGKVCNKCGNTDHFEQVCQSSTAASKTPLRRDRRTMSRSKPRVHEVDYQPDCESDSVEIHEDHPVDTCSDSIVDHETQSQSEFFLGEVDWFNCDTSPQPLSVLESSKSRVNSPENSMCPSEKLDQTPSPSLDQTPCPSLDQTPCPSLDQNQDTQISVDACDVVE